MQQKVIEFPGTAEVMPGPSTVAPPSIEPIWTVVDSLSRTLDCIKTMCADTPTGPVRDKLEIERANLVIGLFVARVAAMRMSLGEPAAERAADRIASRG
ncbi:hypothetical protein CQ12_26840 [Bradyrhizobium jicamae]|uniref:Uncharacterized protein n=2 Tax=Bradyrhizobium jicamae TaxID=280332 RepID=A0A0R3LMA9_9BRAD|nr:hypothetical protein CQ12_26840 [Bradyrhizobium jicamae]